MAHTTTHCTPRPLSRTLPALLLAPLIALTGLASPDAEAGPFKTLDYLYSISGKQTVAGMHNRYNTSPRQFTDQARNVTGRQAGLWSGDFLFESQHINKQ